MPSGRHPSLTTLLATPLITPLTTNLTTLTGGQIDNGHHANRAFAAFNDTVMFSDAVQRALDLTSREDTLVVVTADHSHTVSMSGYPKIGNGILGWY